MKKKASIQDLALIIIFISMFTIASIIGTFVYRSINANSPFSDTPVAQRIADDYDEKAVLFDRLSLVLMVGLGIAGILSSFLTRTHPAFAFVGIIIWVIMMIMSVIFSNMYEEIASQLTAETSDFVVSNFIMTNLPLFILVYGALMLIVFYSVNRE